MKLTFQKEDALRVMTPLQGVIGAKSMLPILSHVILEAGPERATLSASDLEIWISCALPASIEEEGSCSLPGRRFFNIIRELPGAAVRVESGDDLSARLTCARSFFQMNGLPREEFPAAPELKNAVEVPVRESQLKELIKKTGYAISVEDSRFVLNGLYLLFEKGELTAVATDGRRLAIARTECATPPDCRREVILPHKTVLELSRILEDEGECTVRLGERQIAFEFSGILLISRLIEGRYPNYQQVIPRAEGVTLTLPREELMQTVKRASLITDEKSNSVRFAFSSGQLQVSAVTPEVGQAREEMEIEYAGPELNIAFNPYYLIDVLKAVDEEDKINLQLIDSGSPGLLKVGERFLCVIMPMKL